MNADPIVTCSAGFKEPWIEWHGPGGHEPSKTVTVDGLPVPVLFVECSGTGALPHDDDCVKGFEFGFALENGLFAISCVDVESSAVWLTPDIDKGGSFVRTETGVRISEDCTGYETCEGCWHACFDMTSYETRDELMAKLDEWSSWTYEQ